MRASGIGVIAVGIICIYLYQYGLAIPAGWLSLRGTPMQFANNFAPTQFAALPQTFPGRTLSTSLKVGHMWNYSYIVVDTVGLMPNCNGKVDVTVASLTGSTYILQCITTSIDRQQSVLQREEGDVTLVTDMPATVVGSGLSTGDLIAVASSAISELKISSMAAETVIGTARVINRVEIAIVVQTKTIGIVKIEYDKSTGVLVSMYEKVADPNDVSKYVEVNLQMIDGNVFQETEIGAIPDIDTVIDDFVAKINELLANENIKTLLLITGGGLILIGTIYTFTGGRRERSYSPPPSYSPYPYYG